MIVAGTILFGGGPVVIPLLRDYVVNEGQSLGHGFALNIADGQDGSAREISCSSLLSCASVALLVIPHLIFIIT